MASLFLRRPPLVLICTRSSSSDSATSLAQRNRPVTRVVAFGIVRTLIGKRASTADLLANELSDSFGIELSHAQRAFLRSAYNRHFIARSETAPYFGCATLQTAEKRGVAARVWGERTLSVTLGDFRDRFFRGPSWKLDESDIRRVCAVVYERSGSADSWAVKPGARDLLEHLRARPAPPTLVAISNFDERMRGILRELDLIRYFDAVVLAMDRAVQLRQGASLVVDALLPLAAKAEEIVYVGSSLTTNEAARKRGIRAFVLRYSRMEFSGVEKAMVVKPVRRVDGGIRASEVMIASLDDVLELI